jgi:hypothetical protein
MGLGRYVENASTLKVTIDAKLLYASLDLVEVLEPEPLKLGHFLREPPQPIGEAVSKTD